MPVEFPSSVPVGLEPRVLAMFWAVQGHRVLPVHRRELDSKGKDNKAPILREWQIKASNDLTEIGSWPQWNQPGTRVGLATGSATFNAFDEDVAGGKPGVETRRRLLAAGLLDPEGLAVVRTPTGGKHYYGLGSTQRNAGWSEKYGADFRGEGGFVLAPGNDGYDWIRGPVSSLAPIDWEAIKEFLEPKKVEQAAAKRTPKLVSPLKTAFEDSGPTPAEWYCKVNTIHDLLIEHGWSEAGEYGGNKHYTRPGKESGVSGSVFKGNNGKEMLNVKSTSTDLEAERGYDAFQLYTEWCHAGDKSQAGRAVRAMISATTPPPPPANSVAPPRPSTPYRPVAPTESTPDAELVHAPILLPTEFFDGCPELEIIRQAAHSRMVSPTALAITVLTRIASMADHKLRLPPLVGTHANLSFYTVLTAKVGGGKSSTVGLAAELLGDDPESTREVKIISGNGTGQGLVQGHMAMVDREDGGKGKEVQQVIHNTFWYVDEGMNLAAEFERVGSVTAGVLCSGWFGQGVGQNNATVELNRSLPAMSYNWGILVAIQDDNAHKLLAQEGIGLTQRCFWVGGWDPTIPDPDNMPEWPGVLDWRHPKMPGEVRPELSRFSAPLTEKGAPRLVQLPDWYAKEQRRALYNQKTAGNIGRMDEHIILMEIKLATLIGMLRGRLDPTEDDIARARIAIKAHKRQATRAYNRVIVAEAANNKQRAERAAEQAESRNEELERRFRKKVTDAVSGGATTTWRAITTMVRGPVRKEMGGTDALAEILSEMMAQGIVQQLGGAGGDTVYGCGRAVDALVDAPHML